MREGKRAKYSKEFKFKIAIEAIKGERQISEIAAEYKIHPVMIGNWKKQLLERGCAVFDSTPEKSEKDREEMTEELIHTIGRQQVKIDWLKKKLGISNIPGGGL